MQNIKQYKNTVITSRAIARNVVKDLKALGFNAKVLDTDSDQRWQVATDYKASNKLTVSRKPSNNPMVGLKREIAHSAPCWLNTNKSRIIPVYIKQNKLK